LRRSIPELDSMRECVFEVGRRFVQRDTDVVDLGCSRGEALAPFVDEFRSSSRFVGVEVSAPMLAASQARFADDVRSGTVRLLGLDLRSGYPDVTASLTLAVLTLQFVPPECRPRVLRDASNRTVDGGALILVEKVAGATPTLDALLGDVYGQRKRASGYSQEEIDRKRLSLEGVLVPLTAAKNEELLREAGFGDVECFWRCLNFAAWVAVKPSR
jgi:tRNA (cmo5U34)-methyltransferase